MKLNFGTCLIASALFLGAAWLGWHEAHPPSDHASPSEASIRTHASLRYRSEGRTENLKAEPTVCSDKSSDIPHRDADPVAHAEASPIGVRLGNKVRLPATAIAKGGGVFATPEIAAANQEMENRFYQNILSRELESRANSKTSKKGKESENDIPLDENGEKTITIEPGPETERALQDSDEAFRSLFGNEAYNRRKLEGLMELRSAGAEE